MYQLQNIFLGEYGHQVTLLLSEINQGMDEWSHLLFHVWYNYLSIHQLQLHSAKPLLKLEHGWVITPHSTMCMTLLMHVLKHLLVMFKHHTNSTSHELYTQLDWAIFVLVTYRPVFPVSYMIISLFIYPYFQGYITNTGAIIWLPQCQWHNPDEYGKIDHMNPLLTGNSTTVKQKLFLCIIYGTDSVWI